MSSRWVVWGSILLVSISDPGLLIAGFGAGYRCSHWWFLEQLSLFFILSQLCITLWLFYRVLLRRASKLEIVALLLGCVAIIVDVAMKPFLHGYVEGERRLLVLIAPEKIATECLSLAKYAQENPSVCRFGPLGAETLARFPSLSRLRGNVEVMMADTPESGLAVRVRYDRMHEFWFGLSPDCDEWILTVSSWPRPSLSQRVIATIAYRPEEGEGKAERKK